MPTETITTELTQMLGIKHPIILAGMNVAAGPKLAAAVTNAGGLGVIGGVGYTPKMLRKNIKILKKHLKDPNGPFGVDLLLPKVGGGARATNYDYTKGNLPKLIDIIIEEGASLFVSAVGVPPKYAVDKFHAAGIPVMNMVGAPKHVPKALAAGVDIICAQGGEGGGHTGDVATSILIPVCVDLCKGKKAPINGGPVHVVAAGGIFDGRGLAMAIALGAQAAWVGTRFVACEEAGAPARHKDAVVAAGFNDTIRTLIFTGRPLRVVKNPYIMNWETVRKSEIKDLCSSGKLPVYSDVDAMAARKEEPTPELQAQMMPLLSGSVAGAIPKILPAKEIIDEMVDGAVAVFRNGAARISRL